MFTNKREREWEAAYEKKGIENDKLLEENRRLSAALARAMDEAHLYREPVKVRLEIDFKNFPRKRGGKR